MISPSLSYENVLQIEDKTRLDASRSFVTNDGSITDVLIDPESGEGFISIFNSDQDKWYLDWAYETDGIKTITVRVETDAPSTRDRTYSINILSKEDDSLFSSDSDLIHMKLTYSITYLKVKIHTYMLTEKLKKLL